MLAGVLGVPVSALLVGSAVWNAKLAGRPVAGVIAQVEASPGPALMIVAKAVAVAPTATERLSGSTAAARVILVLLFWTKLALTGVFALSVSLQASMPLHPPPDQPAKVEPVAAVAATMTCAPVSKLAVQVEPQLIPDGVLVTVPEPVPEDNTDSILVAGLCLKVPVTVVSEESVN
jgi:hypothetical protein